MAAQRNSYYSDTFDSYISKIKEVAALLNSGEPQILELFKNTLPTKLYWISFPINNLRDAVDAMKRVLTKEKLDKQLSGQDGITTPFMKVEASHTQVRKCHLRQRKCHLRHKIQSENS